MPVDDDSGSKVSFGRVGNVESGGSVAVDLEKPGGGGGECSERLFVGLISGLFLLALTGLRRLAGGDCWPWPARLKRLAQLLCRFASLSSPLFFGESVDCDHPSKPSATLDRLLEPGLVVEACPICLIPFPAASLELAVFGRYVAVGGRSGIEVDAAVD